MDIAYIKGSKDEFISFLDSINLYDRVAILTHIDLDGVSSALFLEKILEAKGIKVSYLDFLDIKHDLVKEVSLKLNELGIRKIFFCDLGIDSIDFEGFNELTDKSDVFLIDHHPMNPKIERFPNVIKTGSQDCSAMTIFDLGEEFIDAGEWEWLNCAAMFSDYSYKDEKNFMYLKKVYPEINHDNLSSSIPGMNSRKINSALIYYKNNIRYVYDLLKERKMEEISDVHEIIEDELNRLTEDFSLNGEYSLEKDMYFYEINSNFDVVSTFATIISKMKPDSTFIFAQKKNDAVKISARNSYGRKDMGALMTRCVADLESASGGGHKMAGAAKIKLSDLEIFKERLLE